MEKDVGEDELDQHEEDVEDLQVVMDKERLKPVRFKERRKKDKLKQIGCIRMNNMKYD